MPSLDSPGASSHDSRVFFVGVSLLLLLLLPIAYGLARATELFVVSATQGKLHLVRGRLPQALFEELSDVARRNALDGVEIRAVRADGQARVIADKVSEGTLQQLRNVVGRFPLQRIRSGTLTVR